MAATLLSLFWIIYSRKGRLSFCVTGLQDMLKNWMKFLAKRHISELRSGSSSPSKTFRWLQPQSSILSYILLTILSWKTLSQNHQISHYWIPDPQKLRDDICCFKLLSFEVACYPALVSNTTKSLKLRETKRNQSLKKKKLNGGRKIMVPFISSDVIKDYCGRNLEKCSI